MPIHRRHFKQVRAAAHSHRDLARDGGIAPKAVVRRARFEGGEFEVVRIPSMVLLAQGFTSEQEAQSAAELFNASKKGN